MADLAIYCWGFSEGIVLINYSTMQWAESQSPHYACYFKQVCSIAAS